MRGACISYKHESNVIDVKDKVDEQCVPGWKDECQQEDAVQVDETERLVERAHAQERALRLLDGHAATRALPAVLATALMVWRPAPPTHSDPSSAAHHHSDIIVVDLALIRSPWLQCRPVFSRVALALVFSVQNQHYLF